MEIIQTDIVIIGAGYAGIDNLLFYDPKCSMFFGDAKKALTELVSEIKQL